MDPKNKVQDIQSMDIFSPHLPLPKELAFGPAAYKLHKIGLTLLTDYQCPRSLLEKPFVIPFVLILYITKTLYNFHSNETKDYIHFGKFSHFMGLSFHFDGVTLIFFSMIIISQILYANNYLLGES